MKRLFMISLLAGVSVSSGLYAMEFLKNPWGTYVAWRDKNIIERLKKDAQIDEYVAMRKKFEKEKVIEGNKSASITRMKELLQPRISPIIEDSYQMPLYIRVLSRISPTASEEAILKPMYEECNTLIKYTFYPQGGSTLFAEISADDIIKLSSIEANIELGIRSSESRTIDNFNRLVESIRSLIEDLQAKNSISEGQQKRFKDFLTKLKQLEKKANSDKPTAVEQLHRDYVKRRVREHLNL